MLFSALTATASALVSFFSFQSCSSFLFFSSIFRTVDSLSSVRFFNSDKLITCCSFFFPVILFPSLLRCFFHHLFSLFVSRRFHWNIILFSLWQLFWTVITVLYRFFFGAKLSLFYPCRNVRMLWFCINIYKEFCSFFLFFERHNVAEIILHRIPGKIPIQFSLERILQIVIVANCGTHNGFLLLLVLVCRKLEVHWYLNSQNSAEWWTANVLAVFYSGLCVDSYFHTL